ncbi:MAG: V-type ATP synthase subunit D, partial [Spirochaetota bacterium]|nr:V-type ATP synthase subunit D [Spirochaetota bacterium]
MAIRFQYNKTSLQDVNRQLSIREKALPTLKNKESALRYEVSKVKEHIKELDSSLEKEINKYDTMVHLWCEFNRNLVEVKDVKYSLRGIAGIKVPVFEEVIFSTKEMSLVNNPGWFLDGIVILKDISKLMLKRHFMIWTMELLDKTRKKTTQKVNLYEKVQIPGY